MIRGLLDDTRRAAAAILAGTGLGVVARVARASSTSQAKAAHPSATIDWSHMDMAQGWTRLTSSLVGTAPMFLQLALIATGVVLTAMLVQRLGRANAVAQLRADARARIATTFARILPRKPKTQKAARVKRPARPAMLSKRKTPASVRALAATGASRAEIARKTGLSQDAVGLALAV